jgi:hypothetical protein
VKRKVWLEGRISLALMVVLLLVGFGLRVAYLTVDRFHADEALYAGWALRILDGDPFLLDEPVDKPPFYLYVLAGGLKALRAVRPTGAPGGGSVRWDPLYGEVAARMPSLVASVLGIALVYRLGKGLYDQRAGLWAALFMAMSPYDILFARTAFTDPMLVLWMLGALCAVAGGRASAGRWQWAGICLGMAFATKQHALLLIPLVIAVGWIQAAALEKGKRGKGEEGKRRGRKGGRACPERSEGVEEPAGGTRSASRSPERSEGAVKGWKAWLLGGVLGFAIPLGLVMAWDARRWAMRPGFWRQSAMSYGGLSWAACAGWDERLGEWLAWARYLTGSPVLNLLLVAGGGWLVARWAWRTGARKLPTPYWLDALLAAYIVGYLILHTVVAFSVWDRYLLPLVPLLGLLLGRIVVQGLDRLEGWKVGRLEGWKVRRFAPQPLVAHATFGQATGERVRLGCARFAICLLACIAGWRAAHNGYPVGGDHWAYQGLDKVTAYLKEHAPPDAVLYHHWLRWHYTYYLYDTDFELRWWESAEHLRREAVRLATRTPERAQYIVLPDWHTLEPVANNEFHSNEFYLRPIYEAHRKDGSVSMRVYQIEHRVPRVRSDAFAWVGAGLT